MRSRSASSYRQKVGSLERVRARCAAARRQGKRIVFTNGCFDLLHPGHVRYLAAARDRGDVLVVGLNGDRSVRQQKGPGRPVQTAAARAEVLAALACVDHVVIFAQPTPLNTILALRPDVLVKGADWGADEIVGAPEVRGWGGRVARIRLVPGESTTRLVAHLGGSAGREKPKASGGSRPSSP